MSWFLGFFIFVPLLFDIANADSTIEMDKRYMKKRATLRFFCYAVGLFVFVQSAYAGTVAVVRVMSAVATVVVGLAAATAFVDLTRN